MYKIKIYYSSGDSFGSRDVTNFVDGEWKDLDVVKENLKRIQAHDEYFMHTQGHSSKTYTNKELRQLKREPWFVDKYETSLNLVTDEGKEYQYGAFWCGYFESLQGAEVVMDLPSFGDIKE